MAIRTISYSVKSDGISPNTEQQAGLQSEHAVTELVFTLDSTLYQALLSEKSETDTLVYRFDCCDSMGGAVKTEPSALTGSTVTFTVGENLTRSGGKARVYLVISRYNAEEKTETELLSFPAKLRFENVPETDSDNGVSRESLSTLTEAAKNAAERAKQSADTAVEAQGKTETARLAIEGGSTVIFDGNGTYGETDVDLVVDTELSKSSDNAISNKAVATKFESVESDISENRSGISAVQQAVNLIWNKIYPVGAVYISVNSTSPATLFGGTWEAISQGRCLMGVGKVEANNDNWCGTTKAGDWTAYEGSMGGEVFHTLKVEEMPENIGTFRTLSWNSDNAATGAFSMTEQLADRADTTGNLYGTAQYKLSGNGYAHNNMPPYLAVYMWKRTA